VLIFRSRSSCTNRAEDNIEEEIEDDEDDASLVTTENEGTRSGDYTEPSISSWKQSQPDKTQGTSKTGKSPATTKFKKLKCSSDVDEAMMMYLQKKTSNVVAEDDNENENVLF
jgi:hypothetical protein